MTLFCPSTWSGRFRGKLVQYIARHFKVVPSDAERPDHDVLCETERRQFRDVFDIDVLVRRRLRLDHSSATATATATTATDAARIVPRPHQGCQSSSVRLQVDVLHNMLIRAADHDRVFVMMFLTHSRLFASLWWPRRRQGWRHGRHVVARSPGLIRRR